MAVDCRNATFQHFYRLESHQYITQLQTQIYDIYADVEGWNMEEIWPQIAAVRSRACLGCAGNDCLCADMIGSMRSPSIAEQQGPLQENK